MDSIKLSNGNTMPIVGFGTWSIADDAAEAAVREAIEAGYCHFDCAHLYQNEKGVGRALQSGFKSGKIRRDSIFVTSKLWHTHHRPELVAGACRRSLEALQLDYLDLYLVHAPPALMPSDQLIPKGPDGSVLYDTVSPESTWKAMEELVSLGLVKSIGLSNFNCKQIDRILHCAKIKPVVLQVESHVGFLNQELINHATRCGLHVTAYAPLGAPGTRNSMDSLFDLPAVKKMSAKYGKTPAQILLRHCLQRGLSIIPKSVTPSRIRENLAIFDFKLTAEEMAELTAASPNVRRFCLDPLKNHPEYPFI